MSENTDEENKLEFATSSRRLIPIAVGCLGILLIVGGIVWNYIISNQKTSSISDTLSLTQNPEISTGTVAGVNSLVKEKIIKIDISGSVMKPGVVEMTNDSRIQDVLISAGGLAPKADRIYVSRNINLAQKVSDGEKIYIPAVNEVVPSNATNQSKTDSVSENANGLININDASESQLDSLPGVGPVTATKIIAARPYQDINELNSKKVVGASVFEKIKDLISTF